LETSPVNKSLNAVLPQPLSHRYPSGGTPLERRCAHFADRKEKQQCCEANGPELPAQICIEKLVEIPAKPRPNVSHFTLRGSSRARFRAEQQIAS